MAITFDRVIGMGVGRGGRGASPGFLKFQQKRLFSYFPVGKNKPHHFCPLLEKFL